MPMALSFILSVLATGAFLFVIYGLLIVGFGARNRKAQPKLTLLPGGSPGTLGVSVIWNADVYSVQIWRIRFRFFSPARQVKDSQFTITFESPMKESFFVPVSLPKEFTELFEASNRVNRAILTVEARGVENFALAKDFRLPQVQKIYHGSAPSVGKGVSNLALAHADAPAVTSLDHSELVVRRDRLKALTAAAKAKVKPAPAAKPIAEAKA